MEIVLFRTLNYSDAGTRCKLMKGDAILVLGVAEGRPTSTSSLHITQFCFWSVRGFGWWGPDFVRYAEAV